MNEFVVTIDNEKFNINLNGTNTVQLDEESTNYEITQLSPHTYKVLLNKKVFHITSNKINSDKYTFLVEGNYFESLIRTKLEEEAEKVLNNSSIGNKTKIIKSPMPGLILRINKNVGDSVEVGNSLILLEAMKMENEIRATASGIISDILIIEGTSVEKNQELILIK